jgi:Mrp family chromosome partitioning ATPase
MTRIFDALRKAQLTRPAPLPPLPAGPAAPPRPAAASAVPRVAEPRLPALESVVRAPVPEDVVRELTHMRFALESALPGKACRVVAATAAQSGVGVTSVASDLARVLAQDPAQRVLLVDANLRRPGVAAVLDLRPEASLREVLTGGADLAGNIFQVERRNLRIVCARPDAEARGMTFPLAELREFLAGIGGAYDWVVLDVPPVLESPDAAAVAAAADGAVLVLRAGRSKRPVAARAVHLLQKAGARVLGCVLNRRRHEIPDFLYRRI